MRTMIYPAVRPRVTGQLHFKPITIEALPAIRHYLDMAGSRTCDYTIGGIYMWIDYFSYRYCISHDTLFIQGVDEDDLSKTAYSMPIGPHPMAESINLLRRHCLATGQRLCFSAIPEDSLHMFTQAGACQTEPLVNWSDYIYDAQALATMAGNKLKKKRNHINRFMTDNPAAVLEPFDRNNIAEAKALLTKLADASAQPSLLASTERSQVYNVLDNWALLSPYFEGAILRDNTGSVVAFSVGEIIGDTLFVHIEKMDHDIPGAGETINKLFAEMMTTRHPGIRYINREEDVGDEGLRAAKESYHPLMLLHKFNVLF